MEIQESESPLKNKQGRPRQRWIENVLETVNLTKEDATTLAQESRTLWRSIAHERANVQKCRTQAVRNHATLLRPKPTQRTGL